RGVRRPALALHHRPLLRVEPAGAESARRSTGGVETTTRHACAARLRLGSTQALVARRRSSGTGPFDPSPAPPGALAPRGALAPPAASTRAPPNSHADRSLRLVPGVSSPGLEPGTPKGPLPRR